MMCRLDQQPYKLHYTVKPGLSSYPQGMAGPQLNTGFSRIGVKRNKECHFVLTVLRRKIIYGALRTFALQMLTLNLGGKRGINLRNYSLLYLSGFTRKLLFNSGGRQYKQGATTTP